jgi:hypothetical protein
MLLTPQDVQLLFKLHRALMFFVNQRLKVLSLRTTRILAMIVPKSALCAPSRSG